MKIFNKIVMIIFILIAITANIYAEEITSGPVSYYGEMLVENADIIGSITKKPFQVAGLSLFWSNTGWGQEKQYKKKIVKTLVDDWKIEIIRASMGADANGGYLSDKANRARVETIINAAIENDIYVIVDWHSHHAEDNPNEAARFFGQIAQKYGQYDNVIFEIYNEPLNISWNIIKEYAAKVIPAIREHSDNLIVVGTPTWSQRVDIASGDPIEGENIAYTLHFYAGTHGKQLRVKGDQARRRKVAIFATEWGSVNANGDGGVATSETNQWIRWMQKNKISWCNWAVSDKSEGASIWDGRQNKTSAGEYVYKKLAEHAAKAEWRKAQ